MAGVRPAQNSWLGAFVKQEMSHQHAAAGTAQEGGEAENQVEVKTKGKC